MLDRFLSLPFRPKRDGLVDLFFNFRLGGRGSYAVSTGDRCGVIGTISVMTVFGMLLECVCVKRGGGTPLFCHPTFKFK